MVVYKFLPLLVVLLAFAVSVAGECRKNWINYDGSCYWFANMDVDWHEAQFECVITMGGYLAEIESARENTFLRNQSIIHYASDPSIHNYGYWIGGSDMEVEGKYMWMKSRRPFSFTDWDAGQPDNQHHEDCIHMNGNYHFHWNDMPCSYKAYFICEMESLPDEHEIIG